MLKMIKQGWHRYISWCDRMGLTLENKRSCVPYSSEPVDVSVKRNDKSVKAYKD